LREISFRNYPPSVSDAKTSGSHNADELVAILTQALPESLAHDGCEAIYLRRDQDDPTHIVSFTQWATRQHHVDYLAWRTETGLTDEDADMLTECPSNISTTSCPSPTK
jgi:quinol monooxygenase YgiN